MVYSINLTYRGSDVNVIRGLFSVAFDFVTIDDESVNLKMSMMVTGKILKMMKMMTCTDRMRHCNNYIVICNIFFQLLLLTSFFFTLLLPILLSIFSNMFAHVPFKVR